MPALQCVGGGHRLALVEHFAFTDQRQAEVGEGSEITGRADRALAGNDRRQAQVVHRDERVDHFHSHPGKAARQTGRLQQQGKADDALVQRIADTDGVRSQKFELKDGEIFFRDPRAGELAETGVDAVNRRFPLGRALHQLGASADSGAAGGCQSHRNALGAAEPA